jgi:hypothetical protein
MKIGKRVYTYYGKNKESGDDFLARAHTTTTPPKHTRDIKGLPHGGQSSLSHVNAPITLFLILLYPHAPMIILTGTKCCYENCG